MMVMVPMVNRFLSDLGVATTVSVAVVGTVAGAVYVAVRLPVPVAVMVPQPGLQVGRSG